MLEIDYITVKGKKEPEVVYAILGREDVEKSDRFRRLREINMRVLACYRSRDWAGALAAIEEGRVADTDGRFAAWFDLYVERIQAFRVTAPPDDWDGVYALQTK
jgi:adenylate cyclase